MQEFLRNSLNNFLDFFRSLDLMKKIGLIVVGLSVVTIMISVVVWANKSHFSVLYTDLKKEDTALISQMLKEGKIPYQIENDGKTILVPEDKVEIWRLEIAKRGVDFNTTVGYEVFDKQSFGTTSFVQKINRQRALEGELVKTIKHIKGVNRARVHLSIPESSPFISEQKNPSASVVLEVEPGYTVRKDEIKGVQHLVSASVEGMRVEDVIIIDGKGKKLTENMGDPMAQYTASRMALESKMNKRLENQVEEILSKVVGNGKVIAKVTAKMDFTQTQETKTTYDPESIAVLSEVVNKQVLQGRRPSPQGIPGARSNLPGEEPQPGIPETRNDVNKELSTRNYSVPKTITKSNHPTAKVENISVAVMVDGKYTNKVDAQGNLILDENDIPIQEYQEWSEEELQNFQSIVASALGIDVSRGDKVVIKNMRFATEDLARAEALLRQKENREIIKNLMKYLVIGLLIALFLFVVVRPFIQWVTENSVESIEDFLPKTIEELEKLQANQKLPGLEDALPTIEDKLNPEKIEGNMLKERIITLIEADPAKAAQVVHEIIHTQEAGKEIA